MKVTTTSIISNFQAREAKQARSNTPSSATAQLLEMGLQVSSIRADKTMSAQEQDGKIKQMAPQIKQAVNGLTSKTTAQAISDFIDSTSVSDAAGQTSSSDDSTAQADATNAGDVSSSSDRPQDEQAVNADSGSAGASPPASANSHGGLVAGSVIDVFA